MERTLPGPRQEARQQEPWGGLVQTPALESTTRPPPSSDAKEKETQGHRSLFALHTRSWGPAGRSPRQSHVAGRSGGRRRDTVYVPNPQAPGLRGFLSQQSSPRCRRPRAAFVTVTICMMLSLPLLHFFFFKPIHLNFSFVSASFILSNTLTYSHAIKIGNIRLRSIQITSGGTCGVLSEAHIQHAFLSGG